MNRLFLILLPTFLLASETDIFPRTINFLIFAGVMYFLLAKHVKRIYKNRIDNIQDKLIQIEKNLDEAKKNKANAAKNIQLANQDADKLILLAQEQASRLSENILKDTEREIENLRKFYEEQKELDIKKAKVEVVDELLNELLGSNIKLNQNDLLEIVSRKVS